MDVRIEYLGGPVDGRLETIAVGPAGPPRWRAVFPWALRTADTGQDDPDEVHFYLLVGKATTTTDTVYRYRYQPDDGRHRPA